MKPDKVGPKEAAIRAQREAGLSRVITVFKGPKGAQPTPKVGVSGVKGVRGAKEGQKARIGRPPSLTKADHDAVKSASPELLAVALRYYLKHAARNLKQKA